MKKAVFWVIFTTASFCATAQIQNSVALDSILSPTKTETVGSVVPVIVKITNVGLNSLHSCEFGWTVNGTMQVPVLISFNPPFPNDSNWLVYIGNLFVYSDSIDICVWVSMPNGVIDSITYDDTLCINVVGCVPDTTRMSATICEGETYSQNGFNESVSGIRTQELQNRSGCDSVVILNLFVAMKDTILIFDTICQGDIYNKNGFNDSVSGTYTQNLRNGFGCDSVVMLTLAVINCGGNSFISGYVGHGDDCKSLSQKSVTYPAEDVSVYLQQDQSGSWNTVAQTLTDIEGYFEFRDVSAGRYRVILDIDGLEHIDNPQIVDVNDGDTIRNIAYEITEEGIKNKSGDEVGVEQLRVTSYKLQVYPNPTTGQLKITNGELREGSVIEIYNIMGQVVLSTAALKTLRTLETLESGETTIDVQHLAKGMYFLKVGNQVVRFVKE